MVDEFEPDLSASEAPARTTMGGTVLVGPRDTQKGDYAQLAAGPPAWWLAARDPCPG
jgi:hypothetical protein